MVKVMITKLVKMKAILVHLPRCISKFSSTMVKVMITKLVKMKAILVHLPRCNFKIFFNHGE